MKKIKKIIITIAFLTIGVLGINYNNLALENKIEIKNGSEIITQTAGTLETPKVLEVNTNVEKRIMLNYIGLDKTKLQYNLEEKQGNLDFDVNVLTGEIKIKVKSGLSAGVLFSIVDTQTNKVYPISLVIKVVDGKNNVNIVGSVNTIKLNTISGISYFEGKADIRKKVEGTTEKLTEIPVIYLENVSTGTILKAEVEKSSTYEYTFRVKTELMNGNGDYEVYGKIATDTTYSAGSILEKQLNIETAVPNIIENTEYKITKNVNTVTVAKKATTPSVQKTYTLKANTNDIYGYHRADGNDYIIGSADIFLRDESGNRVKGKEVKIYGEKNGVKVYFNVYNERYDFELMLNNVEIGEYTIYAETVGPDGKKYSEKLWIGGSLRKDVTVNGMKTTAVVGEGKVTLNRKETQKSYIIRTNTNDMYGYHRADGNDYIIGSADIFLRDESGNRVKGKEVKIYGEKNGSKVYFNVYNERYDFELLLNNVEIGEYTIYAETVGPDGKKYSEKLWIGGSLRKDVTVNGMKKTVIISDKVLIEKREKNIEYTFKNLDLVALIDERQYIHGNIDVRLKEIEGGASLGIKNVKIYILKDGEKTQFYTKNLGNGIFYYDLIINSLKNNENYPIYIEVEDNTGQKYTRGLDFTSLSKKRLMVRGFERKVNFQNNMMYIEKTNNDEVEFEQGIYGQSGLKVKGDSRGQDLQYYKFGNGKNVFYATFAMHGFEDLWNNDGKELTYIAEKFKEYLLRIGRTDIFKDWTLYVFPKVNPDGTDYGWTQNGPGRTTLYSEAPGNKGIDLNRNFKIEGTTHNKYTSDRNYNGEKGFEAYEAKFLAEFLKTTQSTNGKNIIVDTHGWLGETIGDNQIGEYYRQAYGMNTHVGTYGSGYLVNWAKNTLNNARAMLLELPATVKNHNDVVNQNFAEKFINATINMLKNM